jgi:hypothetical protein
MQLGRDGRRRLVDAFPGNAGRGLAHTNELPLVDHPPLSGDGACRVLRRAETITGHKLEHTLLLFGGLLMEISAEGVHDAGMAAMRSIALEQ